MRNHQACPTTHLTACQHMRWGFTTAKASTCCSAASTRATSRTVLAQTGMPGMQPTKQATGSGSQGIAYEMQGRRCSSCAHCKRVTAASASALWCTRARLPQSVVCTTFGMPTPPTPCTSAATKRVMLGTAHQHSPQTAAGAHAGAQVHCHTALSCLTVWLLLWTRSCCTCVQSYTAAPGLPPAAVWQLLARTSCNCRCAAAVAA
jgi:hypothetical protein